MPLCCFSYLVLNKVCCKREEFTISFEDENDDDDINNSRIRLKAEINNLQIEIPLNSNNY